MQAISAPVWYALGLHLLLAVRMAAKAAEATHPCGSCHAKEVKGFSQSAMAHSLSLATRAPKGTFEHSFSGTRFTVRDEGGEVRPMLERPGWTESLTVEYAIGSGNHATGYLTRVGDHLFQAPVAYYTNRGSWDVAPGYEDTKDPDFSRPTKPHTSRLRRSTANAAMAILRRTFERHCRERSSIRPGSRVRRAIAFVSNAISPGKCEFPIPAKASSISRLGDRWKIRLPCMWLRATRSGRSK